MRNYILAGVAACAILIPFKAQAACDDRFVNTCSTRSWHWAPDRRHSEFREPRRVRHVAHHASVRVKKIARTASAGAKAGGQASVARGGLVTVTTAANIPITVASNLADKFVGFIADLVAMGHKPRSIGCYARGSHIPGSNHYYGAACDIDQRARNVAAGYMFHVADLTKKWGLTNGCSWRNPDCGHIEVSQHHEFARAYARYAHHIRHRQTASFHPAPP